MEYEVTLQAWQFLVFVGWLATVVGAWFAGGYYKSRRKAGMSQDEITEEAKAATVAHVKVLYNEIRALNDKIKPGAG